jgi:hypothetical protein
METLFKLVNLIEKKDFFTGYVRVADYSEHEEVIPRVESYYNDSFFKGKINKDTK